MTTLFLPLWLGCALDLLPGDPRRLSYPVVGFGRCVVRYRRAHASPDIGCPEAALAGSLDVRFAGSNRHAGEWFDKPRMGENSREIVDTEIGRVVHINHAVAISFMLLATAWLFFWGL
jgi:cobalamin biosynthesis protein CobD/CbiB